MSAGQRSILVIEDQADQWKLIQLSIRRAIPSCQAVWAVDQLHALEYLNELAKDKLPDLILLDLYLPQRENGFEVLRAVKESTAFKSIPVVIFSNSGSPEDISLSYQLGCSSYMIKPVEASAWSSYFTALHEYWWLLTTAPRQ